MGALFERIKRAVQEERYVFSNHADEQLRERRSPMDALAKAGEVYVRKSA
jgi:hypothetical protein